MPFILSLDEGTTSARAALYDREGRLIGMEAVAFPCQYPHPGWVEQDALAIWDAQMEAARRVLARTGIHPREIAAAGIANQRETTVVWDRETGKPVAPAIVWQCRRTADYCAALRASAEAADITAKTGLVIDAYFSASKIRWILDNVTDARAQARDGRLLFGTIDTWLAWKLTNGREHVTDATNASRTLLMNLATGEWDDDLLRIFRCAARHAAANCAIERGGWRDRGGTLWSGNTDRWNRGRPAGGAGGSSVLRGRPVQKHVWHRMFRADAYGHAHAGVAEPVAGYARRFSGRDGALRD